MKRGPRILSAALAVVLTTSLCGIPAYAVEDALQQETPSQELPAAPAVPEPVAETPQTVAEEPPVAPQAVGSVRVKLVEGRATATGADFAVALSGPDGFQKSETVALAASGTQGSALFEQLPDGAYELAVSSPGFATYRQQIEVEGDASALEVHTGDLAFEEGAAHPNVINLSG